MIIKAHKHTYTHVCTKKKIFKTTYTHPNMDNTLKSHTGTLDHDIICEGWEVFHVCASSFFFFYCVIVFIFLMMCSLEDCDCMTQ